MVAEVKLGAVVVARVFIVVAGGCTAPADGML